MALLTSGVILGWPRSASGQQYVIAWGGDTFLGDRILDTLEEEGYHWPLTELPDLASADLTIVNLETPLVADYVPPPGPDYSYLRGSTVARYEIVTSRGLVTRYAMGGSPKTAHALAEIGVDVVTLGNNHTLDFGAAGLAETHEALQSAGIVGIGAGATASEAASWLMVDTPFGPLAVVSFGKVGGTAPEAGVDSAGVYGLTYRNVIEAARSARQHGAQWVVAAVHWGRNYEPVRPEQVFWAERFAANGYNLVIGHGPHVAQTVSVVNGMPVLYSLGNMVFSSRGRWQEDSPGYGLIARTKLTERGFREIELECIRTANPVVDYRPRQCTVEEADAAFDYIDVQGERTAHISTFSW